MAVQICAAAEKAQKIHFSLRHEVTPGTGNPIDSLVKIIKIVPNAEMRFGESFAPFGDAALSCSMASTSS